MPARQHQIDGDCLPHFPPRVDQPRDILARLACADKQEIRIPTRLGSRRSRPKEIAGRQRHRHHSIRRKLEPIDRRAAHGLRGSDHHGRQAHPQQARRPPPHARRIRLPGRIEPRAQIVQRHHAGSQRNVGNGIIGSVKQFDPATPHLPIQSPQPPFALGRISRPAPGVKIGQAACGDVKSLVREQPVLVVGVLGCESPGQFQGVAADASGRYREGSRVEGDSHGASVG